MGCPRHAQETAMVDEDQVRRRAHEIWEREGRPEGRHEEHWRQAMEEASAGTGDAASGGMAGSEAPGPDAGLRTPPSAVERGLHEAADALRGASEDGGSQTDRQSGQATEPASQPGGPSTP
jgi:hypothetical protein